MDRRLWLRWSWRDLRRRPVQVIAIALVIAIGTGLATGLASMQEWRTLSNDASFASLAYHGARVSLAEGGFVREGRLARVAGRAPATAAGRERLVLPTQVDASRDGRAVLVPGLLVGQQIDPRPVVDGLAAARGRVLGAGDDGRSAGMLESRFADARKLPASGTVTLAGGATLRYTGWAFQPQFFFGGGGSGADLGTGAADAAVVFTSLRTAQRISGHADEVNEVVVRARPGVAEATLVAELRRAFAAALPGVGVTVTPGTDEQSYRLLYKDAEGDQKVYIVLSALVLLGAALAAYNLISRTVEAERREIGIGMALGVPPARLALRPVLMGAQIAVLGALLGVAIGYLLTVVFGSLLESLLPLPVYDTPFLAGRFLIGAAIGIALPMLGVLLPVRRAVRMRPIEAIRVGFRAAGGGGLAPLLARVPVPGGSLVQMPLRNLVRAPRRTVVSVMGIGLIVALVVTFGGLIDSFLAPLDRARAESQRVAPDRLLVSLGGYERVGGRTVRDIVRLPETGSARAQDQLGVELESGDERLDGVLTTFDPAAGGWTPSTPEGAFSAGSAGITLAPQAAEDLGVAVGDTMVVRHPRLEADGSVRSVRSRVRVDALHGGTLRPLAYGASAAWDPRTGLRGLTNQVEVIPAPGISRDQAIRAIFAVSGVASVQAASAPYEALDEYIDRFLGVIYATEAFILLLALLVAFNSAAISADERRREHATMFAYGVPPRTVVWQGVAESGMLGVLASVVGVLVGLVLVGWMVLSIVPETVPDLEVWVVLSPRTLLIAAAVGIVACALAPLFTARRLRHMDVASTLRVME